MVLCSRSKTGLILVCICAIFVASCAKLKDANTFDPDNPVFKYVIVTNYSYTVSTFVGSGSQTSVDGTGTNASLYNPRNLVVDPSGNIYIVEAQGHKVRKITSSGVVTTSAGSGVQSYADGVGTAASFKWPSGICRDSSGTMYVAESFSCRIRKIVDGMIVSTLAGSGNFAYADGTGTSASFKNPYAVAVDTSGNVFVSDLGNNRIRKVTASGVVTTFAGSGNASFADGTGGNASFYWPAGIAIDSSNNLYVADSVNNRIRKITPNAVVTSLGVSSVGIDVDGPLNSAQFSHPVGITIDKSGNIFVVETSTIRMINALNTVSTIAGSSPSSPGYLDGSGKSAIFNLPSGIGCDDAGNIYIGDEVNNRVRKLTPDTPIVITNVVTNV